MKRVHFIAIIQIACLATANAADVEEHELKELLSESLGTYKRCEEIKHQRDAATEELDKKLRYVRSRLAWLKQPPFDEERIRNYTDNIAMAKNRIEVLERYIEFAKITDPNKRAELAQKYENDRRRILAEELEAGKPFRERSEKVKQEFKDRQKPFEKAMESYCLLPRSDYPAIASTSVDAQFCNGKATYKWLDNDNKQLGWAWISIKERPNFESDVERLDDKFFVTKHYPSNIEVWAGNFRIELHISKLEWFGKEQVVKLVKDLIDLEGLAGGGQGGDSNGLDALVRDSLACWKKLRPIQNEQHSVVRPLTDERVKVKNLKHRLKKPPADREQLKKDREEIDYRTKALDDYRGRLEICTITDSNERAAMLTKLEAEKERLEAEKREITKPYDEQYRKLTRGLGDKDQLLDDTMKGFFLRGQGRYEGISEVTTEARFSQARISCHWKDEQGDTLCWAKLRLRGRVEISEDAQTLDGVYQIGEGGKGHYFIWVRAGDFLVYFDVKKEEWLEKEKVGEILKSFVDLPGLSAAQIN